MSKFVVNYEKFSKFLDDATYSPVTKNKERKRLLQILRECIGYGSECFEISTSHHTSIITFLMKDGKGDKLRDDELLNYVTSVSELSREFEIHCKKRTQVNSSSSQSSPVTEVRSLASSAVPKFREE